MSIDKINPFQTNPFKADMQAGQIGFGAQQPKTEGPGAESPMYGMNKGTQFQGFKLPESQGTNLSFMPQGALGENAMYGNQDQRLGGKLNVVA